MSTKYNIVLFELDHMKKNQYKENIMYTKLKYKTLN